MGDYSSFLFARPSFLEGMGRVLDFGGTMTDFNRSLTPEMADELAMRADWSQVGADLLEAVMHGVEDVQKARPEEAARR